MKREEEVSFRISQKLRDVLERLAESRSITFEEILLDAVEDYVYSNALKSHWGDDQRKFNRSKANIPAELEIRDKEGVEAVLGSGTIIDISMGGVRISLPKDDRAGSDLLGQSQEIGIRFRVPGEDSSLMFKCKPARTEDRGDNLQVGVSFSGGDFNSLQLLHRYVM